MLAVAKRLLPRAVDRNTVRRIAREAWRHSGCAGTGVSAFIRLARVTPAWREVGDRARKRAMRDELDRLLASLRTRAANPPPPRTPSPPSPSSSPSSSTAPSP